MKTILLSILILFSINGFAFNWQKVTEHSMGDSYIDIDNIKKRNGLVYYWTLDDYLEPPDVRFNSIISKFKVNCVEEKQTWLNGTYYSQSMGRRKIIVEDNSDETQYPKPNSVGYIVMKSVCNYVK
ncbi:MAG: surface-adhesin E family protein [Burkholderiaceae bacterium]